MEGVEVLTMTEADHGTCGHDRRDKRVDVESQEEGKLCLMVVDSVHWRMSVSIYLSQEVWSGLHESSSRIVSNPKKHWKGLQRLSEVADFVAIEWPKRCAY